MKQQFIESLKRLFAAKRITKKKLKELVEAGTITTEERDYIIGV